MATLDGAGPADTGNGSDGAGGSRAESGSEFAVDAKFVDAVAEGRDDAAIPALGFDATGDFGGGTGTRDGGGAAGETGDASLALPDANFPADQGGASQGDGLFVVDLAAGNDGIEFVADGPGEDAGIDVSVPLAIDAAADTAVPPDLASVHDVTSVPFTVNAGADQSICSGWPATLSAQANGGTPPYAYAWSANPACSDCIDSATTAQTDVVAPATTTFTVTAHDSLGAVATDSVTITVVNPVADASPEVSINPGASVRIGTPGLPGYTYAWTCDRPTCALSSASAAQPTVNPRLSTMYTVAVTSPGGCAASDSTTVWVNLPVVTTPQDGEPAYPSSASLLVQFGAAVLTSSISTDTVILRESASGTPVPFSYTPNPSLRTLTITPTYNPTVVQYTLTLVGGDSGIVSNDSLRPQRLPNDRLVRFTLATAPDVAGPTIIFRSPNFASTGVAANTSVVVTFSETLDPASVTATNFAVAAGPGPAAAIVPGTLSYDAMTSTIMFVPTSSLTSAPPTTYTVRESNIKDLSGNIANTPNWSFTTGGAADTRPPTVTTVSPAAGATRASAAPSVVVTFSEPVDPTTLAAGIQLAAGTSSVAGMVTYNPATQTASFAPVGLLASQTLYTLTVAGVDDLAGNLMTAAFTSTFTTANALFADSFESGTTSWTLNPPWGLTTEQCMSASHSLTDSPGGNYQPNVTNSSATSIGIDVTGVTGVSVSYWLNGQTQAGDTLRVEYSTNGPWTTLDTWSGIQEWALHSRNITPLPPGTTGLQIRFRFNSNGNQQSDGMYVDDVIVQAL
jgi:hypothetical protein